ncbi:MAG: PilZ domain-containing protein [Acidobacteria bacterium]|nr:PilZ domain-containing protein [Acidobacteriota bacterium]
MNWQSHRQSERIHIAVSVRISGQDLLGRAYDREAWTLDVSGEGASLHIPEDLHISRRMHVTSLDYQFRADADVDVVWERRSPQRAVGVRVKPGTPSDSWQSR